MRQYQTYELIFYGEEPEDSYVQIDLEAVFETIGENGESEKITVKGFYAGEGVYKVRFYPTSTGLYSWHIFTTLPLKGDISGEEICEKAEPESIDERGMVKAVGTHFEYADGTFFYPFGTTIYALAHQESGLIGETYQSLRMAPFNKVRHCVFPKHYDYNHNEPPFYAFEKDTEGKWDVNRPCFAFWEHMENVILKLAEMGIQSDLILFHPYDKWGFASMDREKNLIYLDYLLRRFSAFPSVWWSLANEFDLCFQKTMEDWHVFEEFIAENDPYHHLLSNHNCFSFYDFKRKNITHCCMQSNQMIRASQWLKEYQKPVIYDECCYEGNLPQNWGNLSGFELANRFWIACVQGAYVTHGEVFLSDDEILWWSKGGRLKGESVKRISFLKEIIEEAGAPLEPWEMNPFEMMDEELIKQVLDTPFALLPQKMPLDQQEAHLFTDASFMGRIGKRFFIQYMGIHCNGRLDWVLPENVEYKIEVIDMWEMTRTEVMRTLGGKIQISLPGKEGMAVLATAV